MKKLDERLFRLVVLRATAKREFTAVYRQGFDFDVQPGPLPLYEGTAGGLIQPVNDLHDHPPLHGVNEPCWRVNGGWSGRFSGRTSALNAPLLIP